MKIAVIGCGAMGSIYAALLADAGNDVFAVTPRQETVDAINVKGLRVEGASGDRTVAIRAFADVPNVPVDLAIVATKAAQIPDVAPKLARVLGDRTIILALQNGVGSADILANAVSPDRLCIGIAAAFGAIQRMPGHVFHNAMNAVRMGPYANLAFEHVEAVATLWREAGFTAEAVRDVVAMQWEKLICNVAYSAPCALTGLTVGQVMDDPDMGPISRAAAIEAWTVARALGVAINITDPVAHVRAFAASMPGARPSLLQDLERGRRGEIDVINGAVPIAAAKVGLEAPVNATLRALVRQREQSFVSHTCS
jgi:2-dehydropantoate 2-reductase